MSRGKMFFRPPGEYKIILNRAALGKPWSLAGDFFHEMAHFQQETGMFGKIAKPFLRASAAAAKPGEKNLARLFLYLINPVEGQAFASGLTSPVNALLLLGHQFYTRTILNGLDYGIVDYGLCGKR